MQTDWNPILRQEFNKPYWVKLQNYILDQRESHMVFPAHPDVFRAFHLTSFATLKVVILGQDPYHGVGQANGLCFSVSPGVSFPPSLQNIFKELEDDLGVSKPQSGDLAAWAEQGILLLNTTLTVRQGAPASHQGKGWETFTDEVIRCISHKKEKIVFVLWGHLHDGRRASLTSQSIPALSRFTPHPSARTGDSLAASHFLESTNC